MSSGQELLIKHVCQYLKRPRFEVVLWPEEELEYWACYFSIDHNKDKPIIPEPTLVETKSRFRELMD